MLDPTNDPAILRALLDQSPDLIALSEFSGRVVHVNPAGRALVGLPAIPDPASPLHTVDFFTTQGLVVASEVEEGLKTLGHWQGRGELRRFDTGEGITVAISTFVVQRSEGAPDLIASIIRDRRQGHRRDEELEASAASSRQSAEEQRALAELSCLAVEAGLTQVLAAAAAAAASLIDVQSAAIGRLDDPADEFLRLDAVTFALTSSTTVPAGTGSLMGYALARNTTIVCGDIATETRFETSSMAALGLRSGVAVPIPIAATVEPWGSLSIYSTESREYDEREVLFLTAVAGVLSTALRRIDLDRQLRHRSMRDALTGLPNRTLAYEIIDDALERARDESSFVALLLLDIDDFKIINDSLGHDSGDRALMRFAQRLTSATRVRDTVARLGGDEFLIVCEGVDSVTHAEDLARHISTTIAAPLSSEDTPIPLSASIGIAVSEPDSTRRELIHRADLAMYRAKDSGTGGHAVFDTGDLYDADRIRSLSIDLRAALADDTLSLAYQPLVDIASERIVGVEALARWEHPTLGEISPTEFVGVAERTGLATVLGSWALRTACRQAALWREFTDITIRVNVSALQLRNPAFPHEVEAVLTATGLPPRALGLEITETVWVADTDRVADTLTQLHSMGVVLLLDDMGKGHSSISYLDRYPMFECFKIDKSYIGALPAPRAVAVVSAIVALAKAFDVTVVGEGVETQEQLDALSATGCEIAQGYLLGRPSGVEHTTELLRADTAPPPVRVIP